MRKKNKNCSIFYLKNFVFIIFYLKMLKNFINSLRPFLLLGKLVSSYYLFINIQNLNCAKLNSYFFIAKT